MKTNTRAPRTDESARPVRPAPFPDLTPIFNEIRQHKADYVAELARNLMSPVYVLPPSARGAAALREADASPGAPGQPAAAEASPTPSPSPSKRARKDKKEKKEHVLPLWDALDVEERARRLLRLIIDARVKDPSKVSLCEADLRTMTKAYAGWDGDVKPMLLPRLVHAGHLDVGDEQRGKKMARMWSLNEWPVEPDAQQ